MFVHLILDKDVNIDWSLCRRLLGLHAASASPGPRQRLVTSLLLCGGGGALLATAMLRILPRVRSHNAHNIFW